MSCVSQSQSRVHFPTETSPRTTASPQLPRSASGEYVVHQRRQNFTFDRSIQCNVVLFAVLSDDSCRFYSPNKINYWQAPRNAKTRFLLQKMAPTEPEVGRTKIGGKPPGFKSALVMLLDNGVDLRSLLTCPFSFLRVRVK